MEKIHELMAVEQRHRFVFYRIMNFCKTPQVFASIEKEASTYSELSDSLYSINALLSWLVEAGALKHTLPANEAEEESWEITDIGVEYLEKNSPVNELEKLILAESDYTGVFKDVIKYCEKPKKLSDIESHFSTNEILTEKKVAPTYVVLMLERAGGIEWDNGWKATNIGIKVGQSIA